jgi:signal transduction histidine kinase
MEQPEKAFEAFFTTKENGMGMGLAICRSIIEAHHGRIWVASGEGPGTTVCFTLPLKSSGVQ